MLPSTVCLKTSVDVPRSVGGNCIFFPRVSGGRPSFLDSVEDLLFLAGRCIFAPHVSMVSLLDAKEEPLLVGGSSISAEV